MTSARNDTIKQMLEAGADYGTIAQHLGVSKERVRQIIDKAGIPNPRKQAARRVASQHRVHVDVLAGVEKTASKTDISLERLKELLHYDRFTGVWTWLVDRGPVKAGDVAGTENEEGYIQIRIDRKLYMAHVLAWFYSFGQWPKNMVDHDNRRRAENWLNNLRQATCSQNFGNVPMRKCNTSGFKGVWKRGDKWVAEIAHIKLGTFDTPEQAAQAYAEAAKVRFGQFASTT